MKSTQNVDTKQELLRSTLECVSHSNNFALIGFELLRKSKYILGTLEMPGIRF